MIAFLGDAFIGGMLVIFGAIFMLIILAILGRFSDDKDENDFGGGLA